VLNEQRINQAAVQSQGFNNNYMGFLTRRAKLWKYYWKTYWKHEEIIRVLEKKDDKDPDWIAINKIVADEYGGVKTENSLDDADAYDITFEDSWKSPTMRDKTLKQLSDMMQGGALKNDPEMASIVMAYSLLLSDAPQDFKNQIKAAQEAKKQAAEAQAKAGPMPEPIRLSMSVDAEALHDPNTVLFLEGTRTINPDLAKQMLAAGPIPAEGDGGAQKLAQENQALKLQLGNKSQELQLKAADLQIKAQDSERNHQVKTADLAIKAQSAQSQKADPTLAVAHVKATTEIEKAHINAAAKIHTTRMGSEASGGEGRPHSEASEAKEPRAQDNTLARLVADQGRRFGKAIQDLSKAVHAPKKIKIQRNGDGKIVGASVEAGA
jgi:hypothetical protein